MRENNQILKKNTMLESKSETFTIDYRRPAFFILFFCDPVRLECIERSLHSVQDTHYFKLSNIFILKRKYDLKSERNKNKTV